jgi:hypothetical protein
MEPIRAHDQPSQVAVEEGIVIVEGPDGVAVTLTPEAAAETGRRLSAAANEALGGKIPDDGGGQTGESESAAD